MIISGITYVNNMLRVHLRSEAAELLIQTRLKIESEFLEPQTTLIAISENIRTLILEGKNAEEIYAVMTRIADELRKKPNGFRFDGLYGYFYTLGGILMTTSTDWVLPQEYDPTDRPWYSAALEAEGKVAVTPIYLNIRLNDYMTTCSRIVFDDNGKPLAIVCLNMPIDRIKNYVADMRLTQGSYGIIYDENLIVIYHPDTDSIGQSALTMKGDISQLAGDLSDGNEFYGHEMLNYQDILSVFFSTRLDNGWTLYSITPKAEYYQNLYDMTIMLIILGIIFATILCIILTNVDNSKRKADEQLIILEGAERASRAKSEFLSRMSHEIRTPLNAIIGMLNIASATSDIEKIKNSLAKADNASKHLLALINDILDISKIEADKFELLNSDFNLEKMLINIAAVLNNRIEEKNQKLEINLNKDVPLLIYGDELRLSQVITNLLSNAIKFTPENGKITLNINKIGEYGDEITLKVEVIDTGIGISEEQQQRLFKSFEQADSSISHKFGGTGLGLAISKRIVELMNGRIWVESELKKGSKFIFIIKANTGKEKTAAGKDIIITKENISSLTIEDSTNKTGSVNFDFSKYTFLIAEDNEINREIIAAILESTGVSVDFAEDGYIAVAKYKENPSKYRLILMDIQMPEMDGYEATQAIRALEDEQAKNIPIIAMTANVFREDVEKCLSAGMTDHIGKPIDAKVLYNKINRYIG